MTIISSKTRQMYTRTKLDVYALLEEDAKKIQNNGELRKNFSGVGTIVNSILEKHYAKKLEKIRNTDEVS